MSDKEINQELRLKKIDETKNYSIEKIKQNDLMTRNIKQFKWCVSIPAFTLLVGVSVSFLIP